MHVGLLKPGEHSEELYSLMESFCLSCDRIPNREMVPYVIPWAIPSYRMWGLFDGDRLVGIQDGFPIAVMYFPYYIGVSQWFYVEKPYRQHSWRLMRQALRYAKQVGVGNMTMVSDCKGVEFWKRHKFTVRAIQLERVV